jgi:hypothetical protein
MRCVPAHDFTVAKALAWRSAIADDPPYQRKSAIWSLDKRQLFIDSLLNGYDVPKIYLHDLRGRHPTRVYAVVDGKQRLTTMWGFLTDEFPLADDFEVERANLPELPDDVVHPAAGQRFSQLDPEWQRVLRRTYLAVVLIQNATETDIEDLFSRLNNGEPLTPAEKRNAVGGDAAKLIRTVAAHRFFRDRVTVPNGRYQHLDAGARLVLLENAFLDGQTVIPDLGIRELDAFVITHRRIRPNRRRQLREAVLRTLDRLADAFRARDRLLATQASIPVLYLVARSVRDDAPEGWSSTLRAGVARFEDARRIARHKRDGVEGRWLREFNRHLETAATDGRTIARRHRILADSLRAGDPVLARAIPAGPPRWEPAGGVAGGTRVHSTTS